MKKFSRFSLALCLAVFLTLPPLSAKAQTPLMSCAAILCLGGSPVLQGGSNMTCESWVEAQFFDAFPCNTQYTYVERQAYLLESLALCSDSGDQSFVPRIMAQCGNACTYTECGGR